MIEAQIRYITEALLYMDEKMLKLSPFHTLQHRFIRKTAIRIEKHYIVQRRIPFVVPGRERKLYPGST